MYKNNNSEWSFLDLITIIGFCVGLQNLELNITQNDLEEQTSAIDKKVDDKVQEALADIHEHLRIQDEKLDRIIEVLKHG